jgi:hypothetical protein
MADRRVASNPAFDRQVEKLGGYERLDPVLFPVIDSLYANPYGAFLVDENEWTPLCRYIITKPTHDLPAFVVTFTIEDDGMVLLREIENLKAY